jgi:hypothetical protein
VEGRQMTKGKVSRLWLVNMVSFVLFILLGLTGLMNWLLLPKGYEARGSFLVSIRHFLVGVHEWTAVVFILIVAIHIGLHWGYIKNNFRKHGILRRHDEP